MPTIRVWHGCTVVGVFSVTDNSSVCLGPTGGANNSTQADIELDPWSNLVVDNRADHPVPISIREAI